MSTPPQQEAWLRGAIDGFDPLVMPVVHALIQVREDLERLAADVRPEHVWARPGGAASIGFHARHIGGALDRLFTYARAEPLSEEQKAAARVEELPGDPAATLDALVRDTSVRIDRAMEQLRATTGADLPTERRVGRAGLPSTVGGLLFHAAEHSTRHAGQALTTAKILSGLQGG
jgi:hypothetical protein